jgi:hypothetical protein
VSVVPEMLKVTVYLKRDIPPNEGESLIERFGDKLVHLKDDSFMEPKVFTLDSSAVKKVTLEKLQIRLQSDVYVFAPDKIYDLLKSIDHAVKKA